MRSPDKKHKMQRNNRTLWWLSKSSQSTSHRAQLHGLGRPGVLRQKTRIVSMGLIKLKKHTPGDKFKRLKTTNVPKHQTLFPGETTSSEHTDPTVLDFGYLHDTARGLRYYSLLLVNCEEPTIGSYEDMLPCRERQKLMSLSPAKVPTQSALTIFVRWRAAHFWFYLTFQQQKNHNRYFANVLHRASTYPHPSTRDHNRAIIAWCIRSRVSSPTTKKCREFLMVPSSKLFYK